MSALLVTKFGGEYSEVGIFDGDLDETGTVASGNYYSTGSGGSHGTFQLTLSANGKAWDGTATDSRDGIPEVWHADRISSTAPTQRQCVVRSAEPTEGYWQNTDATSGW